MPQPNHGESTASGTPAASTTTIAEPAAHAPRTVEVSRTEKNSLVMRLVAEHGSTDNALLHIAGRVIRYQKRAQEAERQSTELRKALPADGSVVLTGEEAKAILKLREQKVDLAKLPDTVKDASELRTRVTAQERKDALTEAAGAKYHAVRLAKVLGDIPVEFKDGPITKDDGTKDIGRIAYVKKPDGTLVPLDTYLETDHKDWLEVLKLGQGESNNGTSSTSTTGGGTSSTGGATMPKQTQTGSPSGGAPAPKTSAAAVDKQQSRYLSPSQRAAADKK